jgi:hypothetical protein
MSRTVTLREILVNNRLLKRVADGECELDPEIKDDTWPYGFPVARELAAGNDLIEGYQYDAYVGFHPPEFRLMGAKFWLVGRYIIVSCGEIDSLWFFMPDGDQINRFETAEFAKIRFEAIAAQVEALHRLVLHWCTCGHPETEHGPYSVTDSDQTPRCRIKGCDCSGLVRDYAVS